MMQARERYTRRIFLINKTDKEAWELVGFTVCFEYWNVAAVEIVTLSGMERFKRHLLGNISRNPEVDCGWLNGYLGCMNHLFIRTDICTHLAETADDLVLIDDRNPLGSWIESLRMAIFRGELDVLSTL